MQAIHITLHGKNNVTYSGTLILQDKNWTSVDKAMTPATGASTSEDEGYDQVGASYYVIAVVLVYGMSIVMLIASHIKRRHEKVLEDKQIDKYLQDFQIVKERHDRDTYKNLKKTIMAKINWDRHHKDTYKNLQQSIIPVLAIGMPVHREVARSASTSLESLTSQRPARKALSADNSKEDEDNLEAENAARQLFDRPRRFSETSDVLRRQLLGFSGEEEPEVPNGRYLHPGSHRPSEASLTSVHSSSRRQIFTVEESCEDDEMDEDAQKARDKYEAEQAARQLFDRPRRASICVESTMKNPRMLRRSSRVQSIDELILDQRDLNSRRDTFRDNSGRSSSTRDSLEKKSFDIPPIDELGHTFERRPTSPHRRRSTITPPVTSSRSLTTSPVSWSYSQGQSQREGQPETTPVQTTSQQSGSESGSDTAAAGKSEAEQASCDYCRVGTGPHCGDVVWLDNNTSPDSGVATPTRDYLSPPSTVAPAITITRVGGTATRPSCSVFPNRHPHGPVTSTRSYPQPAVHCKPSTLPYAKPPSPFFQRSRSAPQAPGTAVNTVRRESCTHQHSAPAEPTPRPHPKTPSPRTSGRSSSPTPFQRQAAVGGSPPHCSVTMDEDSHTESDSDEKILQITVL